MNRQLPSHDAIFFPLFIPDVDVWNWLGFWFLSAISAVTVEVNTSGWVTKRSSDRFRQSRNNGKKHQEKMGDWKRNRNQ